MASTESERIPARCAAVRYRRAPARPEPDQADLAGTGHVARQNCRSADRRDDRAQQRILAYESWTSNRLQTVAQSRMVHAAGSPTTCCSLTASWGVIKWYRKPILVICCSRQGMAVTVPAGIIGAHRRVRWGVVMGGRRGYGWWYLVVRSWWEPSCALPGTGRMIAV